MKRSNLCLLVLLSCALLVALVPTSAFAVDGVVLINQSTIISGLPGCTDPNPGKFPIIICQSGSYRLSSNLTITGSTDGIDITSANVTLDLNGFTISGSGGGNSNGISSFSSSIAVRNGSVTGFYYGVSLSGYAETIDHILAIGNSGVALSIAEGAITNSVAKAAATGISPGTGLISGNTIDSNSFCGIVATGPITVTTTSLQVMAMGSWSTTVWQVMA